MTAAYVHGFRCEGSFAWPMKHYLYAVQIIATVF